MSLYTRQLRYPP